jgi:very-short-patch-repair endonuclease
MKTPNSCENCSSLIYEKYGSGRFCSSKCARSFSAKVNREETNKKISKTLTIDPHILICKYCKEKFESKDKKRIFCSNGCSAKFKATDETVNLKISECQLRHVKNGTHQGWQSRKFRSYAEKFFETVLINNNIKFETEFKIKKKDLGLDNNANYFLDFYLPDFKIDLEIDGKQHDYPERKELDRIRDEALIKNGFNVYRIKWKNPINEINKKYIKNEIDKLLKALNK